ncbi:MAG: hypothetical protein HFJ58_01565 [Clostridia bacterium]|nr:hypothetical protein [Clostridia bacterium]
MEDENFKAFVESMKSHSLKNVSMETQNMYRNNLDRKVELIKKKYKELRELIISESDRNISGEKLNSLVHKEHTSKKSISELQEAFKKIDEETKIVDKLKKEQNLEER